MPAKINDFRAGENSSYLTNEMYSYRITAGYRFTKALKHLHKT